MHLSGKDLLRIENYATESLTRFIPGVYVVEEGNQIVVTGVGVSTFKNDVRKFWNTSRIYNNIILEEKMRSIRIHKWFAVELAYIFDTLATKTLSHNASAYESALAKLYTNTWLKKTVEKSPGLGFDYSSIKQYFNLEPFDYQIAWFKSFEDIIPRYNLKGYMAEVGTGGGKTLLAYLFHHLTKADLTILLVHRPTLQQVFVDRLPKYFKVPPIHWDSINQGKLTGKEKILIIHHDYMDRIHELYKFINKYNNVNVWIDESQKFTEETSNRVKKLYELCDNVNPRYVIHASATPLKARPSEAIPFLKTTDPLFDEDLAQKYTKVFGAGKAVALDMLNNRLGISKFKVTSDQYLKIKEVTNVLKVKFPGQEKYELDNVREAMRVASIAYVEEYYKNKENIIERFNYLHDKVESKVLKPDDIRALRTYREYAEKMHLRFSQRDDLPLIRYCKDIEAKYHLMLLDGQERKEFKTIAPLFKYPSLSIRGKILGNVLGKLRIECFVKITENMELEKIIESSIKKTVVFSSFVEPTKAAYDYSEKMGYKPLLITQETNKDLNSILHKAETDPEANPVCATVHSLGTGTELVVASTAVFTDVGYRDYQLKQAMGRIARASQDTDVTYYMVYLDSGDTPNLSTRTQDILEWSRDQVNQMLGIEASDFNEDGFNEAETDIYEESMKGFADLRFKLASWLGF